jgi:hypothetical protein
MFWIMSGKETIAKRFLVEYQGWVEELKKNNMQFNACRCSHHLLQLLLEVDNWAYWMAYFGCINNPEALERFAYYMANR